MLVNLVIGVIIAAAVIAIGVAILRAMGITIPPVVATVFWIVVLAVLGILAIKVLVALVGSGPGSSSWGF